MKTLAQRHRYTRVAKTPDTVTLSRVNLKQEEQTTGFSRLKYYSCMLFKL